MIKYSIINENNNFEERFFASKEQPTRKKISEMKKCTFTRDDRIYFALLSFICSRSFPGTAYLNTTSLMRACTRALKRTKINERVRSLFSLRPVYSLSHPPPLLSHITPSTHSLALRPIIYLTFSARDIIMDALTALTM